MQILNTLCHLLARDTTPYVLLWELIFRLILCVQPTENTVYRILQLFYNTGTVSKRQYTKERSARKLTEPAHLLVLHLAMEIPAR